MTERREDIWYLKEISFRNKKTKIVTQNFNGPCSFIAICNILILRQDIQILPISRTSVSYEFMSQLVGEYILTHNPPNVDYSVALNAMPLTQKGMDLNPQFTSPTSFRPTSTALSSPSFGSPASRTKEPPELTLFKSTNITLVHGWLSDPSNAAEHAAVQRTGDYDSAMNLIAAADYLSKGLLVDNEDEGDHQLGFDRAGSGGLLDVERGQPQAGPSTSDGENESYSPSDRQKISDALLLRTFLSSSRSQLTYHGLFTLASTLEPGSLVALFRGEHLSVLYRPLVGEGRQSELEKKQEEGKGLGVLEEEGNSAPSLTRAPPPPQTTLYTLVTDHAFHLEPSIVWERLEDVDGSSSTSYTSFVDSAFEKSTPVGGDWAGESGEGVLRRLEGEREGERADRELARQLQEEEDAQIALAYARRDRERARENEQRQNGARRDGGPPNNGGVTRAGSQRRRGEKEREREREKRKQNGKSCVVM